MAIVCISGWNSNFLLSKNLFKMHYKLDCNFRQNFSNETNTVIVLHLVCSVCVFCSLWARAPCRSIIIIEWEMFSFRLDQSGWAQHKYRFKMKSEQSFWINELNTGKYIYFISKLYKFFVCVTTNRKPYSMFSFCWCPKPTKYKNSFLISKWNFILVGRRSKKKTHTKINKYVRKYKFLLF